MISFRLVHVYVNGRQSKGIGRQTHCGVLQLIFKLPNENLVNFSSFLTRLWNRKSFSAHFAFSFWLLCVACEFNKSNGMERKKVSTKINDHKSDALNNWFRWKSPTRPSQSSGGRNRRRRGKHSHSNESWISRRMWNRRLDNLKIAIFDHEIEWALLQSAWSRVNWLIIAFIGRHVVIDHRKLTISNRCEVMIIIGCGVDRISTFHDSLGRWETSASPPRNGSRWSLALHRCAKIAQ